MMRVTTMTMEDTKVGTTVHDVPRASQEERAAAAAPHDLEAPRVTTHGRRLRRWLILGNLVGWVLVFLAARAMFF
jgi:hypothetical protein